MATIQDVKTKIAAIASAVGAVDTKLDTVRAEVARLKELVAADIGVSQADLDSLDTALGAVSEQLGSVVSEVDGIVVQPTPEEVIPVVDGKVDVSNITPATPILDGKSDTPTNADLAVGTETEAAKTE